MNFAGQEQSTPSLLETARTLLGAIRQETALARRGALGELAGASATKQAAFFAFSAAGTVRRQIQAAGSPEECTAVKEIGEAAQENALVLEAVQVTLQNFARRLRAALAASVDPGTYGPRGRPMKLAPAARFEASI